MGKISCIIIDDEDHAIKLIEHYSERIPYLDIMGRFSDPMEATRFIGLQKDNIDLIFLDIQMPRFSGMDFLKAYTFSNVILTTAYSDYALPSYEYGVVDYLLKPFGFERFSKAVNKVYEKMQKKRSESTYENTAYFIVKTERNKHERVNYDDILYINGAQNYTIIKMPTQYILTYMTLKSLESQLPKNKFIRVHRSYIMNLDYFESLEDNVIKIKGVDKTITLGPNYKNALRSELDKHTLK